MNRFIDAMMNMNLFSVKLSLEPASLILGINPLTIYIDNSIYIYSNMLLTELIVASEFYSLASSSRGINISLIPSLFFLSLFSSPTSQLLTSFTSKTTSQLYSNFNQHSQYHPTTTTSTTTTTTTTRMTKPNNPPREKDRALPWSMGLPIFNFATGSYETPTRKSSVRPTTEPRPKSRSEKSAIAGDGLRPRPVSSNHPGDKKRNRATGTSGGVSFVPPKKRRFVRQKNGGLPDDFPTVLFPGVPMAIAMRKTEELEKEFPGVPLTVALEKKKRSEAALAATTATAKMKAATKKAAPELRRQNPIRGPAEKEKKVGEPAPPSNSKAAMPAKTGSGFQRPVFNMAEFFGHGKKQAQLPEKKKVVQVGGERGKKRKAEEEDPKDGVEALSGVKKGRSTVEEGKRKRV